MYKGSNISPPRVADPSWMILEATVEFLSSMADKTPQVCHLMESCELKKLGTAD